MKITSVHVKKINTENNSAVKAKVSVTIDDEIIMHNIKVIEKMKDDTLVRFLSFPSQKVESINENNEKNVGYFDIYHPISNEVRKKFEDAIFAELDKLQN